MAEGLPGPVSGTFGTSFWNIRDCGTLRPAEIWVCAGDDGWSDGLQDLMA